jgi:hypothetical protein
MTTVENPAFEAYLESLGIPAGASIPYRSDMIAAMYRTAFIYSNGYGLPVFPLTKLKGGWIGWIAETIDLQGAEGWPAVSLATKHVVREWGERRAKHKKGELARTKRFRTDAVEVTAPERFDEFSALLRFTHRCKGEERAMLVRGFCQAIGLPQREEWTLAFFATCERIFIASLRSADRQAHLKWRKLAKELGL